MAKTIKTSEAQTEIATEKTTPMKSVEKKADSTNSKTSKAIKDMDKDDLSAMHIRLPKATHKRLRLQRIEEDRPMNDIIVQAIEEYLRRASGPSRKV
ncbi:MAG: hypothetical protein ABJP44_09205 [Sulfitobacter sp.]